MRVIDVSFIYDEMLETEEQQLKQHYTSVGWAEALQRKGVEVFVFKRFSRENTFTKNNVHYHFIKDGYGGQLDFWQIPVKFFRKICELDADVVHLHGFGFSFNAVLLRSMLRKKTALIVQDHKSSGGMRKYVHQLLNSVADGFFFTTAEQGKEWLGFQWQFKKIMPVIEGSPFFNYEQRDSHRSFNFYNRNVARKHTAMDGNPVFLWAGRLHTHKDPLTVLNGLEILFEKYPNGMLYMIFGEEQLINEVKSKIDGSVILRGRVKLLGKIQREKIEMYYNSADYFVLGSYYEGTCYSLSEALSCGCVPVITDIPSFRMMTNNGQLGALWDIGNKNSFVDAAIAAMNKPLEKEANECIRFFKKNLSFDAIAETAIGHYEKIIRNRLMRLHLIA